VLIGVLERMRAILVRGFNPAMPVKPRTDGWPQGGPLVICHMDDPDCCAWDLYSAGRIAAGGDEDLRFDAMLHLSDAVPNGHAWTWEDQYGRTQAEVLNLISTVVMRLRLIAEAA
jgi:hypothetical protein